MPTDTFALTPLHVTGTLQQMVVPNFGIQASAWVKFKGAIFGRDTIRFARDVMTTRPDMVELCIWSLARLQARQPQEDNFQQDGYKGSVNHEARFLVMNGERIGPIQEEIFNRLASFWGNVNDQVVYYGAVDATCDYVTMVCTYCLAYGTKLLEEEFTHVLTGEKRTYSQSLVDAIEWIEQRLASSQAGWIETIRKNPKGAPIQAWRDGRTSYVHEDGRVFNKNPRFTFVSLDVQCKALEALQKAVRLLGSKMPERAAQWRRLARTLQERILKEFYVAEHNYFGMGADHDPQLGEWRLITTMSSLPAETLETGLLEGLDEEEQRRYLEMIIAPMYTSSFCTPVGLRCMPVERQANLDYWVYQGPTAVWPVSNNVIAIGLRRYGLDLLAQDIEDRTINGINMADFFVEFMLVSPEGLVHYDTQEQWQLRVTRTTVAATNKPERDQAWTVSAMQRFIADRARRTRAPKGWRRDFQHDLLHSVGRVRLIQSRQDLIATRPTDYGFHIDNDLGREREARYIREHTEEGAGQL